MHCNRYLRSEFTVINTTLTKLDGCSFYTPRLKLALLLALTVTLLAAPDAFAGNGGAEFDDIYDKLVAYMQGTPGRIVMILAFIVAGISAVVAQRLAGFAVGLGLGIVVYYAQGLVEGVVTATLPLLPEVAAAPVALPFLSP